jgi:hypothetical protein
LAIEEIPHFFDPLKEGSSMKRIIGTLLASVLMAAGLASIPSAANATTSDPPSCDGVNVEQGTGLCADVDEASSYSKSGGSSSVVAVNGVSIHSSVTVLTRIQAKGATPKQMQGKKLRLTKATCRPTSYNAYYQGNSLGERWKTKCYPKGKVFVKGKDGWFHDPVCWNKVKIKTKKPIGRKVYGKVKMAVQVEWQTSASAVTDMKSVSIAKAWCTGTNSYAYGEGRASAYAYAAGYGSARGSVKSIALALAQHNANSDLAVKLKAMGYVDVKAEVRASAFAQALTEASAKAVCKDTPPPNLPPSGEIVQWPAHLYPGGTYRAKVVGSDPEDLGNVTLTYSVTGGAKKIVDADHPEICDVEGTQRVCYFWIQAGPTSGVNATLSLTVTDSKGASSPAYTKTWPIVADEF